jgi:predicted transposase/invertase (TIGR01784 family)
MSVFCKPTRDAIARHLLEDEPIRNSFIRALTPYKDVTASQKIDNALRPLKLDQNLLNILKDARFVSFLQTFQHTLPEETEEQRLVARFFAHLRDNYGEISAALLDEKSPTSDVICRLSTGDYVLIEIQVNNPGRETWDKRALAYAAILYGSQLRKGQPWPEIQSVMALNILGMGSTDTRSFWPAGSHYKRHYRFENILKKPETCIDYLQLIQYSLGNVSLEGIACEEERAWLDFFRNAHRYDHIPKDCPDIVRLAYERVMTEHLPANIQDLYKTEEDRMNNYRLRFEEEHLKGEQAGLEKGEQIGLQKGEMIGLQKGQIIGKVRFAAEMGLDLETVAQKTGLSVGEVRDILTGLPQGVGVLPPSQDF